MADTGRARGLMAGIPVGNLLGIAMKRWARARIAHGFPVGVPDIVAKPEHPDDDDLAQAVDIVEAAIGPEGLDMDCLGRRFWARSEANGAGIGNLTADGLILYGGDYPQRLARNRSAGRLVWIRQRFVKNPETGRRVKRLNPPEEWIVGEVPELRIEDDELWQAMKARQANSRGYTRRPSPPCAMHMPTA